ncbi:MAG: response regulator transcription factor, partial [Sphingobacteriales bacterium]
MKLNAFIVDDESHSRRILQSMLLGFHESVHVAGTAHDITQAVAVIKELQIDILFLDVNLGGGKTGFDLLDTLKDYRFDVVFVTAYDNHSLKAFQYNAVHYLLKPIQAAALRDTISRVAKRRTSANVQPERQFREQAAVAPAVPRVALSDSGKTSFVSMGEIEYLESRGSYTAFHLCDQRSFVRSKNLKFFEDALMAYPAFVRVHKSYIVNRDRACLFRKGT